MRKIAANLIFPISKPPIKNGYLVLSDDGEILDLAGGGESLNETDGLEFYSGILVPGFVNTHCQLELSHLKGKIPAGIGMTEFNQHIAQLQLKNPYDIEKEADKALRYMWSHGISVLGNAIQTNKSMTLKQSSFIRILNFIELFDKENLVVDEVVKAGNQLKQELKQHNQSGNLTPHSFYKTHFDLVKTILNQNPSKAIYSVHYKDLASEKRAGLEKGLQLVLDLLEMGKLLLVNNLYLQPSNIDGLQERYRAKMEQLFWVLCPNSNLYIENKLPPVMEMRQHQLQICLGTDSLASNHQLSLLDEMITLQKNFPEVPFNELLLWATLNGARALGMEAEFGSFEKGKKPGVLLITGFDFKNNRLNNSAEVTRLV